MRRFCVADYAWNDYSRAVFKNKATFRQTESNIWIMAIDTADQPLVTVCIPVYNGAAFVHETIESVLQQDHPNFETLISVDLGNDRSAEICAQYAGRHNVSVAVQTSRLDWVRNTNHLIRRARGTFFCVMPHDDIVPRDYLLTLSRCLETNPHAINAYPRIAGFGEVDPEIRQPSIRGDLLSRTLDAILNHTSAVSFRGLIRRVAPVDGLFLATDIPGNCCADSLQILQHALRGELIGVDTLIYKKRFHAANTHQRWWGLPVNDRIDSWAAICAAMAAFSRRVNDRAAATTISKACARRLYGETQAPALLSNTEFLNPAVRARLEKQYGIHLQRRGFNDSTMRAASDALALRFAT